MDNIIVIYGSFKKRRVGESGRTISTSRDCSSVLYTLLDSGNDPGDDGYHG